MEEDIHDSILERKLPTDKLIETRLERAVTKAQEILDYESAHNPEILQALSIVHNFISKKKRVCYGGTAMNELLPKKYKFYDPQYDLPDYDFLTPDANGDVRELVNMLKAAGFKDVYNRVGVHEGTKKILVNYVAIADITQTSKELFKIFTNNSKEVNGVYYANENLLRMMMYLELSRPRGEVERWKKVFTRLELLNDNFPIKLCAKKHFKTEVPFQTRKLLLDFIISHQRILANIELEGLYKRSLTNKNVEYILNKGGPLFFYSQDIRKDAFDIKHMITTYKDKVRIVFHEKKDDYLPRRIKVYQNNIVIAVIIQELACHSYNNIKYNGNILHIASLQTLITLYYSFYFFTNSEQIYLCEIGRCIKTFHSLLTSTKSQFLPFPITCVGYQKGYPTLLREKVLRIQKEKEKQHKKNTTLKKKKDVHTKQ
jgi:hypothetical protein